VLLVATVTLHPVNLHCNATRVVLEHVLHELCRSSIGAACLAACAD
jgi:hypothetical protein